jgi:hypothetical protein
MILPLNLNRRHKVTLFFTLALAGIAALNGAKMMEVVGILLLGLALAWALGSDSRVVHWLFLSLGLLLTCLTVGGAWLIHQSDTNLYAGQVAAFEQRMPELAKEYPLHVNGQIILDKDLQPYLAKNPNGGLQIDPATGERVLPESGTSGWTTVPEPRRESRRKASTQPVPIPPDATVGNSGVTLDFSAAQPLAAAPATLPAHLFSKPPGELFQLTTPDGHVRYFAFKRDADNCQAGFLERKTQKMWNEAWVAGLDLCPFAITDVAFNELPGYPPKPPWGRDAVRGFVDPSWWVCLGLGVFLFALGLGLILSLRTNPLPS